MLSGIDFGRTFRVTGYLLSMNRAAQKILLFVVVMIGPLGCDSNHTYRPLPAPVAETPAVNPALAIRKSNWLGGPSRNEGSCVHASLSSMLHWQNQFELAQSWRSRYGGGEYRNRLRQRLDEAGIKYTFTEQSNLGLLDFAHSTRRGALLWWKPSHCCTFCGWVHAADSAITYAVILDNNNVSRYELVEKSQFHRLWAGYGGFALTTLFDPASPMPYLSYERIQ